MGLPRGGLPELDQAAVLVVMELIGAAALAWCWMAFGWSDRQNRELFLRTGHLNRDLVR